MKRLLPTLFLLVVSCANQDGPTPSPRATAPAPAAKDASTDAKTDAGDDEDDDKPTRRKWAVRFSPKGGCTDSIVQFIQSAKKGVLVEAYSFTSKPIAAALVEKSKKVPVKVIFDSDEISNRAGRNLLAGSKVVLLIDAKHPIFHEKVVIVDEKAVEFGSFNYTAQAENGNAENCNIVHDKEFAHEYVENWNLHSAHSTIWVSPDAGIVDGGR